MSTRRWLLPVLVVAVLLAATAIVTLWRASAPSGDADPASFAPDGTHALAQLARDRGGNVRKEVTPDAAASATAATTTLVVTRTEFVDTAGWNTLSQARSLVLVGADQSALDALGLPVTVTGWDETSTRNPGCDLPLAVTAGQVDIGGYTYRGGPGSTTCYGGTGSGPLLRVTAGQQTITLVGSVAPLANDRLGDRGNAALSLGLLGFPTSDASAPDVVWFVPSAFAASGGGASLTDLLPTRVWWAVLQLVIAVALLALWRARRLGPLTPEPLPAVVPAIETVKGRGRLYRRARARGRAAAALRAGTTRRLEALGGSAVTSVTTGSAGVHDLLYGAEPGDDAALAALASGLADLELADPERADLERADLELADLERTTREQEVHRS